MKVLVRYTPQDDEDDDLETSFTLTLPKAWLSGPIQKLRHLFVDNFNKKHGEEALPLDKENSRLENKKGVIITDGSIIETCLKEGEEIWVKRGKTATEGITTDKKLSTSNTDIKTTTSPSTVTSSAASGTVSCKRFGCGKKFVPGQPEVCRHHKKPPVFHETRKYWACCPDKIAWDWDSFQEIAGCETSNEHTHVSDSTKKVMGGTELRAEINGPQEIVPEKKITSFDKLQTLRTALVNVGVKGEVFDRARDSVKRMHEDAGPDVWDKVCIELATVFGEALATTISNQ